MARMILYVVWLLGWIFGSVMIVYADTEMTVVAGFAENVVVEQTLTPIQVQIQHSGSSFDGRLVLSQTVETPWRGTFTENLVLPVQLGQRTNKALTVYFPLNSIVYPLEIRLESEAGTVVAEEALDFRDQGQPLPIVVALSETKFPTDLPTEETVYALSAEEMPEKIEGFESFERLYLGRFNLSVLNAEQQQALLRWIMLGGEFVLLTGENWHVQDVSFLRPWLPLKPDQVEAHTLETGESFSLLTGTPQGDVIYSVEDQPWVIVRPVGQGRVWIATVNPFSVDVPDAFWRALRPIEDFENEESFDEVARAAFEQHILKYPSRTLLSGLIAAFIAGAALWSWLAIRKPWGIGVVFLWIILSSGMILWVLNQPQYTKSLTAAEYGVERTLPDGSTVHQTWFGVYAQRREDVSLFFPTTASTRQMLPNDRGNHFFDLTYALDEENEVRFTSQPQQIRAFLNILQSDPKLSWMLDSNTNSLALKWNDPISPEYAWLWYEGSLYALGALSAAPVTLQLDQLEEIQLAENLPPPVVKLWEWAVGTRRNSIILGAWHRQNFSQSLDGFGKQVYHLVITEVQS